MSDLTTYRFLSDEEPTDEQLELIMKEVAESVRLRSEAAEVKFQEVMRLEEKNQKQNNARPTLFMKTQAIYLYLMIILFASCSIIETHVTYVALGNSDWKLDGNNRKYRYNCTYKYKYMIEGDSITIYFYDDFMASFLGPPVIPIIPNFLFSEPRKNSIHIGYNAKMNINSTSFLINSTKEAHPQEVLYKHTRGYNYLFNESASKMKSIQIVLCVTKSDGTLYHIPPLNLVRKRKVFYEPFFIPYHH